MSNPEFPPEFYYDLSEDDLAFLEGMGICDYTLYYWRAVKQDILQGASRRFEEGGDHMIASLGDNIIDILCFNYDGSFRALEFEPMLEPYDED